ncbi:MAG: hypothetical protein AO395_05975 [Candidatus Fermentibacter daniensis]|nr:MAG: hypothetical protein AO395_05975 [Candidatus Fermentibacter daniensis]
MSSEVFFTRSTDCGSGSMRALLSGFALRDDDGTGLYAVKIHAGEHGNTRFVPPSSVNSVVRALDLPPDRTFLTDTTVLYRGRRLTAPAYLHLAFEHGFGLPATPPFIVADGLRGTDEIPVKLPSCCEGTTARIARLISEADRMTVISHFKGHLLTGFGGAIKNLGMGCASRGGKLYQHSSVKPVVRPKKCVSCGLCAAHCPAGAISLEGGPAFISDALCIGCGECIQRCPEGAAGVDWNQDQGVFVRRMVEYAIAVVSVTRIDVFVNFVTKVSGDCDCQEDQDGLLVDDIGILASKDPVALDQACLDLVTAAESAEESPVAGAGPGVDKFRAFRPDVDGTLQLETAQMLGLGSREYTLTEV